MSLETMFGLILYALVTSITPGPNNMMVMASGVNFGFSRSVPHILGIGIGFSVMVVLVGAGLGVMFEKHPAIYDVLRWVGTAYLLHLAWRIARAAPLAEGDDPGEARPMGFLAAAAFQWVNPKAWIMALGALTAYLPPQASTAGLLVLAVVFMVVNVPCVGAWAVFGVGLRRFLTKPSQMRVFNSGMALLLVLSLYPMVTQ